MSIYTYLCIPPVVPRRRTRVLPLRPAESGAAEKPAAPTAPVGGVHQWGYTFKRLKGIPQTIGKTIEKPQKRVVYTGKSHENG